MSRQGAGQEQITADLNLARQVVQRVIATAAGENLIRSRLVHPLAQCIQLAERQVLRAQLGYPALVEQASALMMGIGPMGWQAPLHQVGFITDPELAQAMEAGAVGELLGHGIDAAGRLIGGGYHDRLTRKAGGKQRLDEFCTFV